ncbi:MAG: hypothetical protein LBR52_01230 [Prevotellaceae bacterium]|jgi:hypothetical protein|nr:hypothetical protein [Prevotellaceae bacterium]
MSIFKNAVIALTIALAFTACNSKGGKQPDEAAAGQVEAVSSAEPEEVNESNWRKVVKTDFGIDLAAPQGWSFSDVKSYFNGQKVVVTFKQEGENAAKPREIATAVFNATKAISTKGNFAVEAKIDEEGNGSSTTKACKDYNDCDPVNELLGEDISSQWYFEKDGRKSVSIGCADGVLNVSLETF